MQRPVVVLPQRLSPTSPKVSPRRNAVDSLHLTDFSVDDDPFGDWEMHLQFPDFEERMGVGDHRHLSSQIVPRSWLT